MKHISQSKAIMCEVPLSASKVLPQKKDFTRANVDSNPLPHLQEAWALPLLPFLQEVWTSPLYKIDLV